MRSRSTAGWILFALSLTLALFGTAAVWSTPASADRALRADDAACGAATADASTADASTAARVPSPAHHAHALLRPGASAVTAGSIGETLRGRVETGCRAIARVIERAAARATDARVRASLTHRAEILDVSLLIRSIRLGREAHHTTAPPAHA